MNSKWINFSKLPNDLKTDKYEVTSKDGLHTLGYVKWFGKWRQYCFFPEGETVFNRECLKDIASFCNALMAQRQIKRANNKV